MKRNFLIKPVVFCLALPLMATVALAQKPSPVKNLQPVAAKRQSTLQTSASDGALAGPGKHRPRVALVLEGGGALGFAHIGVIQYLEQHHIPIDLVVGTSMGGLVGGLYSVGYSPDEIRALVNEIDWDTILGGLTPFRELSYRRKQDREAFPNRLEFGLKHGFSFPGGLNSGQQVGLILDRATLATYGLKSFDDLPIPFRCVATNMNTGRAHVFDHGSLANALRATMAIPGLFVPVEIDGRTYTDGGAVDNLPVDVAKANGADIVIASYLDTGQITTLEKGSLLATAGNTISIMVAANERPNMKAADILLRSDLKGYTSTMYKKASAIVPKGTEAAEKNASLLDRFAVGDADWAQYVKDRDARKRRKLPEPEFVTVIGADAPTRKEIKKVLEKKVVDRPIDTKYLDRLMTRFVGYGTLNTAGYSLIERGGKPGLAVTASPKSYGPPFLNLGITIDGSDPRNVLFGMSGRLTFNNLGGYRAEWRTDAFFGYSYGVRSEYYKPFTAQSHFFYAPRAYATSTRFTFYNEGSQVSQYDINQRGFGFDVGYTSPRGAEIRLGQDLYWYSVKKRIDFDDFSIPAQRQSVTSLQFNYLGADNAVLPTSGTNANILIERHERFGDDSFTSAQAQIATFYPWSKKSSLFVTASGGTGFGTPSEVLDLQGFALGGPFYLGSYGRNELLGNQYWLFQGGYERKLLDFNPLVGEGLYGVAFLEGGKVYENLNPVDTLISEAYDGSVALVARTALGPVYVGGAVGDNQHRKWWFGVGHVF